jgi:hypothetical protein
MVMVMEVCGHELLPHSGFVGKCVIGMDFRVSKIPTSTLVPPFRQRFQHFAPTTTRVEFAPTLEGGHDCEPGQTYTSVSITVFD